jgi:hypothetical protein
MAIKSKKPAKAKPVAKKAAPAKKPAAKAKLPAKAKPQPKAKPQAKATVSKSVPVKKSAPVVKKSVPVKKAVLVSQKHAAKKSAPASKKAPLLKATAKKVTAVKKPVPVKKQVLSKKTKPAQKATLSKKMPVVVIKKTAPPLKVTGWVAKQRDRLLQLKDTLLDSMSGVGRDSLRNRAEGGEASAFGMHTADAGSDAYDRDFALSLLSQERDSLFEIDAALKKSKTSNKSLLTCHPGKKVRLNVLIT